MASWKLAAAGAGLVVAVIGVTSPASAVTAGTNSTIMYVATMSCQDVAQRLPTIPDECEYVDELRVIVEMQPDGSRQRVVTYEAFGWLNSPSQAPNGLRIAYGAWGGQDPAMAIARRSPGGHPDSEEYNDGCDPTWAPDSTRLAYTEEFGCYYYSISDSPNPPDTPPTQFLGDIRGAPMPHEYLVATPADEHEPDWSPDGQWITYMSSESGIYQVWAVRPDGTNRHQVTFDAWNKAFPSFAPNSRTILFTRHRGGQSDLWTVKVDGTGLRQVTKTSAYETQGTFSPDGTKITYTRQPSKADIVQSAVYKMRADGTNVVRLTTSSRLPITKATDPFWNNLVKP